MYSLLAASICIPIRMHRKLFNLKYRLFFAFLVSDLVLTMPRSLLEAILQPERYFYFIASFQLCVTGGIPSYELKIKCPGVRKRQFDSHVQILSHKHTAQRIGKTHHQPDVQTPLLGLWIVFGHISQSVATPTNIT